MRHLFRVYLEFIRSFFSNLAQFIKYQLVTKSILSMIIIPSYGLISGFLIKSKGYNLLSNGDILNFLFSARGFIFLIMMFFTVMVEIILEISGYIAISSKIEDKQSESGYFDLLKYNWNLLPRMMSFGGVMIIIYLLILAPLSGFGLKLSFLKGFYIPNFVMSVIQTNITFKVIYYIIIGIVFLSSVFMVFTFHFMIICGQNSTKAIKSSFELVVKNKKKFFVDIVGITIINTVVIALVLFIWIFALMLFFKSSSGFFGKSLAMLLLQLHSIVILLISMLVVPFECLHFTKIFYQLVPNEDRIFVQIKEKKKKSILDKLFMRKKTFIAICLVVFVPISVFLAVFTREFLGYNSQIMIMGHRGFGDGVPENSISSIKKSISEKIDYIEIDVQRTKDRSYVLNHDKNFARVASSNNTFINEEVLDLTYDQIKEIRIGKGFGDKYKNEKVPTIEEVLELCKDKIGINLELKGNVDQRMMDDLMNIVDKKGMKAQVIFTSLTKSNVEYIENKDITFNTGLINYLKIGDYTNINVDYFMLEENEITDKNVDSIHEIGKKVIAWTVNSEESIENMTKLEIDGVITDNPLDVKNKLKENAELTENELIVSRFLDLLNFK
ncbi:glycerophosphodiester phosphodiesterase family protein [Peptostreptococcus sp. D1]|uniref:glycerophosphodiester phosphodiesterase family protein n=1 Tax=Peptostreptococcus sp. D1 TaxID=72304 RepID=UPI0008E4F061|nr:glycerophosphodiester phosphodiesterase family protein [Peptostreptococcus sp. D1]SFE58531.1 glycerophosphoryl diester phosphodiesterase [Peptostreptococcus sp. D1]